MIRNIERLLLCLWALAFGFAATAQAKTRHYELEIRRGRVNISGKKEVNWALLVNGGIPGPVLEFTEGDEAEIRVVNHVKDEDVSVHWHGILLPPLMDGVPYANTPPIMPNGSFTFKFKVRQHGTYWYHSHSMAQEQEGVLGAIVIHPRNEKIKVDRDVVALLGDWSDEPGEDIMKNLRKDGDYYLYKKDRMRSWWGAWKARSLRNYLKNQWSRMGGMDLSDVGYDAFWINGKRESILTPAKAGEKIRVRIVNGSSSTYFYASLGTEPMTVISADGHDIDPVAAKEILLGMAETYDILFEPKDNKSYELKASAQDGTGVTSAWIGEGAKIRAPERPSPDMYGVINHAGVEHGGRHHPGMDMEASHGSMHPAGHADSSRPVKSLEVDDIRSPVKTSYDKTYLRHELKLVLDGDMDRYVWFINGRAISEDRTLYVKEGEVVRYEFVNQSMMHHPMHLHGHFFRVLNAAGDQSPLKHTVDVPPHQSRTIEFLADEPGEWMLHCHNLYHMQGGMARFVKYQGFTPAPEIRDHQKHDPHLHDHTYFSGRLEASTIHAQGQFRGSKLRDEFTAGFENRRYDDLNDAEGELFYRRWLGKYLNLTGGASYYAPYADHPDRLHLGLGYILPFRVESRWLVDQRGEIRLDLEKRLQWTKFWFTQADVSFRGDARTEFEISLLYASSWAWSAGFMFTDEDIGVGLSYRF
jgi:FtsP/CotA-like multicopper oxidase with cupredoxin domain